MKGLKSVIAYVTVTALLFGFAGCSSRRTSRQERESQRDWAGEILETSDDSSSDEIEVETDFGTFTINNGWVAVDSQTFGNTYVFSNEEDVDSTTPPNNLTVKYDVNPYSEDQHEDFCTAILQQLPGQAAAYNGTAALTEFGQFGENMCYRFDLDCEDFDIIQWYVIGDYEYVMFGLMIVDEDKADEDDCIQMTEDAVNSFVWNR